MSKIQFRNAAHRDFVLENLDKCKVNDCYHRAFFYVMGISEETRMNIGKIFFKEMDFSDVFVLRVCKNASPSVMGMIARVRVSFTVTALSRVADPR